MKKDGLKKKLSESFRTPPRSYASLENPNESPSEIRKGSLQSARKIQDRTTSDSDIKLYPFSNKIPGHRLVSRNSGAKANVRPIGYLGRGAYFWHHTLDLHWTLLVLIGAIIYVFLLVIFAALFYAGGPLILQFDDDDPENFKHFFWFALQTGDTIGYGGLLPKTDYHNTMVLVESIVLNLYFAVFLALAYDKVSRPSRMKRTLEFSQVAVRNRITPHWTGKDDYTGDYVYDENIECIKFRVADKRVASQICDSSCCLLLFEWTKSEDGSVEYKMHEIDFELNQMRGRVRSMSMSIPLLCLPWTIIHKIDGRSPFWKVSNEEAKARHFEIICVLDGIDEATSENYQARYSYCVAEGEIREDHEFEPIVFLDERAGKFSVDFDMISKTKALP